MMKLNDKLVFFTRQELFAHPISMAATIGTKTFTMRLPREWIYFPYRWLVFFPGFVGVTFLSMVSIVILGRFLGTSFTGKHIAARWARIITRLIPMGVTLVGTEHIDPNQRYVVVANHQSFSDIFLAYGWLGIDCKWIIKKSVRKFPLIGTSCKYLGHIFIDRSDPTTAMQTLVTESKKAVSESSIFIFPEGTRSETGVIQPFKKGAFVIATELGLPILPVTLNGTGKILPKHSTRLIPGRVAMVVHPPIPIEPYTRENLDSLMEETKKRILQGVCDQL